MENAVREILRAVGEDPEREGLLKTPARVAEAYRFLTRGYGMDLQSVVGDAVYEAPGDEMVVVRDIEVYSLCEHHLLPFYGKCHIGYIPDGKVIGVSKLARITEMFARRLQIQERLTEDIAAAITEAISPKGVAVVIVAKHLCMMMRGVEKQNSEMCTSAMHGAFRARPATRSEFMNLILHHH